MASSARGRNSSIATEWVDDDDNLMLIECWARDGYTNADIAERIGVTEGTFSNWQKKFPQLKEALRNGRELVDYKVENALLKSALGYKTTESKVTLIMRDGVVVEEREETTEREIAPNTTAAQVWLYNRLPKKWKKNRDNVLDLDEEDTSIQITVIKASGNDSEGDENDDSVNESVSIRKSTESEKAEKERKKAEKARKTKEKEAKTTFYDENDENSDWDEWDD